MARNAPVIMKGPKGILVLPGRVAGDEEGGEEEAGEAAGEEGGPTVPGEEGA